jgi:hypothetical protein
MTFMYDSTGVGLLHSTSEPTPEARFREEYANEDHSQQATNREYGAIAPDPHLMERIWSRLGSFRTFA